MYMYIMSLTPVSALGVILSSPNVCSCFLIKSLRRERERVLLAGEPFSDEWREDIREDNRILEQDICRGEELARR